MQIFRLYVEKKPAFAREAAHLLADLRAQLGLPGLAGLRLLQRYDVAGIPPALWPAVCSTVLSEPQVDDLYDALPPPARDRHLFAWAYLPGQFDQRADSAAQAIRLLDAASEPRVAHARVLVLTGLLSPEDLDRIQAYLINPVDSRLTTLDLPSTLEPAVSPPLPVLRLDGFRALDEAGLAALHRDLGLAMSAADLVFTRDWFRDRENRDPSLTEIRVLDTYWSDHCRHTTFHTILTEVTFDPGPATAPIRRAWEDFLALKAAHYGPRDADRPASLMEIATLAMKALRAEGRLPDLEVSAEINAASIEVNVRYTDGGSEPWLVMFKNETHNHPTEIEPFGGAATCLGGAIRDPLSGRSYVYQAMRVTGAGDPRVPLSSTLPGKLPQRKITVEAAHGYSSYGNQIGLSTGLVAEIYHPGYVAKRMEIGAVVGAAPRSHVVRAEPRPGDCVLLVGGATGRDGIGGATGSSKQHDSGALANTAEVQKGNPPVERALQRLFRDPAVSRRIRRCNDFGAGGVAVAIGELAPGLDIDLDAVPRKYEGLDGTELALSESQERMAVVLDPADAPAFIAASAAENLPAVVIARVTPEPRLRMTWRGDTIVDLSREFLDTHGVRAHAAARVTAPAGPAEPLFSTAVAALPPGSSLRQTWLANLADLNVCSQQGLVERFDSTIGALTVLHPFGGVRRLTPPEAMAARLPSLDRETLDATVMTWGFDPFLSTRSPFHGGLFAVVQAAARLVATGIDPDGIRLTLQEYFEKLRGEPARWGKPLAALLGAFAAQRALGLPAVGGKDSMSGSFNELDVPPTLVAFALGLAPAGRLLSPEFKAPGAVLTWLRPALDPDGLPDWENLRAQWAFAARAIAAGHLHAAAAPGHGGLAAALSRMAFGHHLGCDLDPALSLQDLFAAAYGSLLLVSPEPLPDLPPGARLLGRVTAVPSIRIADTLISLDEALAAWTAPLDPIFPHLGPLPADPPPPAFRYEVPPGAAAGPLRPTPVRPPANARPPVLIPVFPGTNCEWDSARAIRLAGGEPTLLVFRNRTRADLAASLAEFAAALRRTRLLFLPGGFSAGDEPDGSGKFIAAVLRSPVIADAIHDLLRHRDGLVLGICNGFQALVKTGLLPFGEIRPMDAHSPTVAFNLIGRHVSCYVHTRVASTLSPWLSLCRLDEIHTLPLSHGEGCFSCPPDLLAALATAGQIATQYCDLAGRPSLHPAITPNGSQAAIEGITSPDGRVFGKMGHSERVGPFIGKNVPGIVPQPIFAAGIRYFT